MKNYKIDIDELVEVGIPYIKKSQDDISSIFILKIEFPIIGSIQVNESEFVVAFSNTCTHMGCDLNRTKKPNQNIEYNSSDKRVICGPCPCHGTSFDLAKNGLVILGPSTQNLPRLSIQLLEENQKSYLLIESWVSSPDPHFEQWPNSN